MEKYITLLGTEEIGRAGGAMQDAASTMNQTSYNFQEALINHQIFLNEWLCQFQEILENNNKGDKS